MSRRQRRLHGKRGLARARMATNEPRCFPTGAPPPLQPPHQTLALLAIVIVTRPPDDEGSSVASSLTWLRSLALNAPGLAREAPALVFATDEGEAATVAARLAELQHWPAAAAKPLVRSFARALQLTNSTLAVHRFPEHVSCIAPGGGFSHVNDVLRYSSIWRSIKRAYGARFALEEMKAAHVLVTDADGYVWKPIDAATLVAHSATVWYADHRGVAPVNATSSFFTDRPPRPDTNYRARAFCSVHPWAAALRSSTYEHAPVGRWAIGRDWASWERLAIGELSLMPAADADLADDPLLVLEGGAFSRMWNTIEGHWHGNLAEATLVALTRPADLYKHCVRGDVMFLELTYRSWMYRHHWRHDDEQTEASDDPPIMNSATGAAMPGGREGTAHASAYVPRVRFRNSTAIIESIFPATARPVGFSFKPPLLPSAIDTKWYHAAPTGFSRLWLYAAGDDELSVEAARVLRQLPPTSVPAFRGVYGLGWANGTARACRVLDLAMRMHGPAAAMQLSSEAPPHLWDECGREARGGASPHGGGAHSGLGGGPSYGPSSATSSTSGTLTGARPRYWGHRGEWEPAF